MADAEDSKSSVGNHVRVQVPPSAPQFSPDNVAVMSRVVTTNTPSPKSRDGGHYDVTLRI